VYTIGGFTNAKSLSTEMCYQVFQCLIIDGENAGDEASLRNAEEFVITDEEFNEFLVRHKSVDQLVPESNDAMRYSYLIVDEYVSSSLPHNHTRLRRPAQRRLKLLFHLYTPLD
jgi:hypothetical protein